MHVSELSWKHVDHPSSVVSVGDEIEVEVLDVDLDKERISLSLKATQSDPWQEFADSHAVGQLVYGRITKLVPFGAFVQVGDGIEGLVHISEMAVHHVDLPEQVVTPGEELWVKIIDIDLQRRRISLSIKQAAEGGEVSEEYREAFGEHAYDEEGNYIGFDYAEGEFTPETEAQAAWADFAEQTGTHVVPPTTDADGNEVPAAEAAPADGEVAAAPEAPAAEAAAAEAPVADAAAAEAPAAEAPAAEAPAAEAPPPRALNPSAGSRAAPTPTLMRARKREARSSRASSPARASAAAAPSGWWVKKSTGSSSSSSSTRRTAVHGVHHVHPGVGGGTEEVLGRRQCPRRHVELRRRRRGAGHHVVVDQVLERPDAPADHRVLVHGVPAAAPDEDECRLALGVDPGLVGLDHGRPSRPP